MKKYDITKETEQIKKELEVMKILEGKDSEIRKRLEQISGDKEKLTNFLSGLATEINYISVCYRYKDIDNIYKLIKDNEKLIDEDAKLQYEVIYIDDCFEDILDLSIYDRLRDIDEYDDIQTTYLCLRENNMTLPEFNEKAHDMFNRILDKDIDDVKKDKCYLPMILFLARRHSNYFINVFPKFNEVMDSLTNVDKNDFSNIKEYRTYRKGSKRVFREMKKHIKKEEKNKIKKK